MYPALSIKRPRQEAAPATGPTSAMLILQRQRGLARKHLRAMCKAARNDPAAVANLDQHHQQLRAEYAAARDELKASLNANDGEGNESFLHDAERVDDLRKACKAAAESLASLERSQQERRMLEYEAIFRQQGVLADLLRYLVLQERVLCHGLTKEQNAAVRDKVPETNVAWDKLSAELQDETATDPLTGSWESGDAVEEEWEEESEDPPNMVVDVPGGGGGAGGAGVGALRSGGSTAASAGAVMMPGLGARVAEAALPPAPPAPLASLPEAAAPVQADGAGNRGVSLLRWSTGTILHHCALLVRDAATNQEVERPYHAGMVQQLPSRFKVKFMARMRTSEDPIARVPPGRSFLFLHFPKSAPPMELLGVVEEVRLVTRSSEPSSAPHTLHLVVRRIHGQPTAVAALGHVPGLEAAGHYIRSALVGHFGLSVEEVKKVDVVLDGSRVLSVLHLPAGTPTMPQ